MLRTIALVGLVIAPAMADDRIPLSKPVAQPLSKPECMCRLRSGERVPLGTRTCLRVDGREYTAECRLSQNVSTWREIAKGCPIS